jgi:hypothetical protein
MDLTPHVASLRIRLEAAVSDEASAATAERLLAALEPALALELLDLLSLAALELSGQLPTGRVELRLAGRDAELTYVDEPATPASPEDDSGAARLTVRMPDSLKTAVETAAANERISTNAWLVNAARRALSPATGRRRPPGHRLTGFAQG